MTRCITLLLVFAVSPGLWAQPAAKLAHRFHKVTDSIYSAIGTGTMNVGSNSGIIINEREVLVVDSHITPASARVLLQELKTLTEKPVRYVVNTHYHFDHAHGNQIFSDDVMVIGHEFTREKLLGDVMNERTYKSFTTGLPAQIDDLKKQIAAQSDPSERANLQDRLDVTQAYLEALAEVKPTPPNVTLKTKLTLFRGGREIQLLFFGRGHTGGDVVVFLPGERIVCTGDLLTAGLAYMGDGYVDEWITTLDALKALAFDTVIPGHGEVYTGKARIDYFQSYLRDIWNQVMALKKQGVPADEAAKRVDMTAHQEFFSQIQAPGVDPRAVQRMYEVMDEKGIR
jgi:glyoxylase-like metal-dependent hydrolase (beta-lactamase superfamily II)